ncbi:hypothetical protein Tco_0497427 [Tanacetum coccineum]
MDEAYGGSCCTRAKIGKCNLLLGSSDSHQSEATLQLVYDVAKAHYPILGHSWRYKESSLTLNVQQTCINLGSFAAVKINNVLHRPPSYDIFSVSSQAQIFGEVKPLSCTGANLADSVGINPRGHPQLRILTKMYYAMVFRTIPPKTKKMQNMETIYVEADITEMKELVQHQGFRMLLVINDSEDDISWKSSDDDQEDDEQAEDDEDAGKNDINETTQDAEDDEDDEQADDDDDDEHDDNKKAQDDDDEELTESDNDGDDFVHPKLTTHDDEIIHEEDTDEDDSSISSSDEEDSDNDVEGVLKFVAGAKSSSVSSGFVSNMLNPNQDTGVDDIFRQNTEATSLIDTNITAIMEPSFTAQINRPPTPHPIIIQPQQQPILTPATTTSSSLQNLPNFASLFGFDNRLKALEDNFSELKQTNQYAEALSSIPSTVEQYLTNKMQEAVDVAVQLKYERIREESSTANQQFLDSIDDGMKKIIKEQVKKEVSKIIPKVEKLVTDQLESEVLVRSSKEANTSHAVAANLSELELKKILKLQDGSNYIYQTVTIKRPRDGADDDEEPSAGTDRGSKRRRSGTEPASTSAPSETTTKTAGQTTDTDVSERPADQEFETGVQDEQAEEEVQHLPDWFQKPNLNYGTFYLLLIFACKKRVLSLPVHETFQPCDGTLDDVRTALNDRLKGIRMEYLPQTFWSQRDKANARAMIQAIDKRLKTRRIMRSLERFVRVDDNTGVT